MMETFSLKTFTTNKKLILGLLFLTFSVSTFLNYGKHHAKRRTGISFFRHPALWTPVRFPEPLSLADSIYWNVMSRYNFHAPEEFSLITSAENSRVYISHPLAHYRTGDTLTVFIETFNQLGYRRTSGGDFFIARAFNSDWKAGVLGTVVDMKNGKYLVMFPLLWEGDVRISIKLYHSAETVAVICKHRHRYPYTVAYKGFFVSENLIETTNCHFDLPQDGPICNFTDLSSGVQWICEKPPSLGCEYFRHIEMYSIDNNLLSKMEEKFLERDNILTEVTPEGPSSVFVHKKDQNDALPMCQVQPLKPSNFTGFFFNNTWISTQCQMQSFDTQEKVLPCLRGKNVIFIGDKSTLQWWEHLVSLIPSLKVVDVGRHEWYSEHLAMDVPNDIVVQWKSHGMPLQDDGQIVFFDLQPAVNQINTIFGGPNVILILTLGHHFSHFHLQHYIKALIRVQTAIERLLMRNPETTIILKNTNTKKTDTDLPNHSDLLSVNMNKALHMVFKGMKVGFVDAWEMTVAYDSWDIHPPANIVKNEVDLFLSHVCHK